MHTVVFATQRVPGMTHEQFAAHYRDIHAPLARRLPGLVSYRQSLIRQDITWTRSPEDHSGYDAISVYVFADDEAADRAWASPEGVALNEDTPLFMHGATILGYVTSDPVEVMR